VRKYNGTMTQAYPLHWPLGWKRTPAHSRQRAKFAKVNTDFNPQIGHAYKTIRELSIADALARIFRELDLLSASTCVVSTNVETRLDGTPRSDRRAPDDPGVAVYFKLHGKDRVLACDKWDRVADNIAAIAAHIDAIRRQDRYGVGTIDQAFAGYSALPPPGSTARPARPWYEVLGVRLHATLDEAEIEYRRRAKVAHPDNGGSAERMAELNAAIAEARRSQEAA
jgi:hypothetical protein